MLDGCRPYSEAERRSASFHSRSLWQLRNSANQVAHGLMPPSHHRVEHLLRPTTASAPFPRAGRCGGNLSRRPYPGTGVELAGSFSSGRWLRRSPLPWHCIDGTSPRRAHLLENFFCRTSSPPGCRRPKTRCMRVVFQFFRSPGHILRPDSAKHSFNAAYKG